MLRRQLLTGFLMTVALTVITGVLYPLAVTGVAQVFMRSRANGSLVTVNGRVVGSSLIGQDFSDRKGNPLRRYFQPRPSATTGGPYNGLASGGSNLGPSNPALLDAVAQRARAYRELNGLPAGTPVPVDAVTSSASGLDPDISVANARLQAARVAGARNLPLQQVLDLIHAHTRDRQLGFLGEQTVNVLQLNLALDRTR